jgi:hypothetical protein
MMNAASLLALLAALSIGGGPRHPSHIAPAAGPQTKSFAIAIDGSEGVQVVAACLVDWGDDIEVVSLKGEVPQTRKVEAVGLACQIQKIGRAGRLMVEITKNGRVVSRNVSQGSSSVISVQLQ